MELTTRHRGWDVYIRSASVSRDVPVIVGWNAASETSVRVTATDASGGVVATSDALAPSSQERTVFELLGVPSPNPMTTVTVDSVSRLPFASEILITRGDREIFRGDFER